MKKILVTIIIVLSTVASLMTIKYIKKSSPKATYTIGILQTASHPALDASREGFMEELKAKLGNNVQFLVQNAQGSITSAHAIAQQFKANKQLQAIYTIATPATQAMHALEKIKPIIIAAVTDPKALGLITPKTNVCGVTDMIDVPGIVTTLQQILPTAKTIGILYTSGEKNSEVLVDSMYKELTAKGLTPINFAMSSELDVAAITDLACRKTDVILAPTDNTVALSMTLIASIALKHKKPLLVSFDTAIQDGALAAQGVNYKESGKQAALIAYDVIVNNKKPYEIPIAQPESRKVVINKKTLDALGLALPERLKNIVMLS